MIDPASGAPLASEASVTVVTRLAARADALSIALLVIGREGAERFAAEHPDVGVLWLEPDGAGVKAWRWNLPAATEVPGAQVDWRN